MSSSIVILAADVAGSKDPAGMKRYEGSEIIGYREAEFDEFLLPLGPPYKPESAKVREELEGGGFGQFLHLRGPGWTDSY